jgi:ERCC4-related helicase
MAAETAAEISVLVLANVAKGEHQLVYVMIPGTVGDGKSRTLLLAPGKPLLGQFGWVCKQAVTLKNCPTARYKSRKCVLTGETLPIEGAAFAARPTEVIKLTGVTHL